MTIIVTGAGGMLGQAVVRVGQGLQLSQEVVGFTHAQLDITHSGSVAAAINNLPRPWTIINCAGIVRGRDDVPEPTRWLVNAIAPRALARYCDRLVQVSTDCVFSGDVAEAPYEEGAPPTPTDWYGRSKARGEVADWPHVTVRGSFIGFDGGLLAWLLAQPQGATVPGYIDHAWSGGYVEDYAGYLISIAVDNFTGVVHLVRPRETDAILASDTWRASKWYILNDLADWLRPDLGVRPIEAPDGPRDMRLRSTSELHCWALPSWGDTLRHILRDSPTRTGTDLVGWRKAQAAGP